MEKEKAPLVQALIAHAYTGWTDEAAEYLGTFSVDQLTRLQEEADARAAADAATATATPEDEEETEEHPAAAAPASGGTVTLAAMQAALAELAQTITASLDTRLTTFAAQQQERQEREQLTAQLAVHGWSEPELAPMPLASLKKLLSTLAPAAYQGLGYPGLAAHQSDDDGPSDDPKWD
jgi:hypothetical protein